MGMGQGIHNELVLEATLASLNNEGQLGMDDIF
jgi:hypothetical protein